MTAAMESPFHSRVDRKHDDFIRSLPCVRCGRSYPRSQLAHVRIGTDGGMGVRPSSCFTVPLCAHCHGRQHGLGERTFWAELKIDPVPLALRLKSVSGDIDAGTRIVRIARLRGGINV